MIFEETGTFQKFQGSWKFEKIKKRDMRKNRPHIRRHINAHTWRHINVHMWRHIHVHIWRHIKAHQQKSHQKQPKSYQHRGLEVYLGAGKNHCMIIWPHLN